MLLRVLNMHGAGLNHLYGCAGQAAVPGSFTGPHAQVYLRLLDRIWKTTQLLTEVAHPVQIAGAFGRFVGRGAEGPYVSLEAEAVDVGANCGRLNPMQDLPDRDRELLLNPALFFPYGTGHLPRRHRFNCGEPKEYAALVARHLRAGKLLLRLSVLASGSIFTRRKRDPNRMRDIWDGGLVTAAAVSPPKPPFLGNPSALAELEASCDAPLLDSARDGEVFFDQLLLHPELQPYTERPEVAIADLLAAGMTMSEIHA